MILVDGDIPADLAHRASRGKWISVDIETSGLDHEADLIGTVQIKSPDCEHIVIRVNNDVPSNFLKLMENVAVEKIFHHALFDLRFIVYRWRISPRNIACTKIVSKIVNPELDGREHSLKPLLKRWVGVEIDKTHQISDWLDPNLSPAQLKYAINDVEYLRKLLDAMMNSKVGKNRRDIIWNSFNYIPTRVQTDILKCGDIFVH